MQHSLPCKTPMTAHAGHSGASYIHESEEVDIRKSACLPKQCPLPNKPLMNDHVGHSGSVNSKNNGAQFPYHDDEESCDAHARSGLRDPFALPQTPTPDTSPRSVCEEEPPASTTTMGQSSSVAFSAQGKKTGSKPSWTLSDTAPWLRTGPGEEKPIYTFQHESVDQMTHAPCNPSDPPAARLKMLERRN